MGRRVRLPGLVALLAVVGSSTLVAAGDEPRTIREGAHFRAVVHFASERAADEMLATVEALWPHAAKLYGLPEGGLGNLLEVHLYRDAARYEVAMEEHANGKFKRNLAAALWESRTAHVAVQPSVSDDVIAAVGLPYLTRNLLLHEASHLVRFHAMPNYRSHPDWLADGAAQWLKFETLRTLRLIDGLEADPMSGRGIERAQEKGDVGLATILDDAVRDDSWYTVYAVKRLFFTHMMAAHGETMRALIQTIKGLGGGGDFKARAKGAFLEALGEKRSADLATSFPAYLRALKPVWSERYRSLETAGEDWIQIAFADTNAIAWRALPVGKDSYVLALRLRILRNYGKQANLLLDQREGGFVSVALTAGYGVTVFAYDGRKDAWDRRAAQELPGFDLDQDHDVRLVVAGTRLRVLVDKQQVADVDFPERAGGLAGPWGLGAQSGSAIRWSGVRLE